MSRTQTMANLNPYQESLLEYKGQGFDLRTRIVDPKTGITIRKQPYSRLIKDGQDFFIRDGKRFNRDGSEVRAAGSQPEKK